MKRRSFFGASLATVLGGLIRPRRAVAQQKAGKLHTPMLFWRTNQPIFNHGDGVIFFTTFLIQAYTLENLNRRLSWEAGRCLMAHELLNRDGGLPVGLFYIKEDAHLTKDGWIARVGLMVVERNKCDIHFLASLTDPGDVLS